jgi:serine/threonine protein kinase
MLNLKKDQILLSRFALLEMVGEGAMGQVWRVRDLELETQVALKIINPRLASRADRVALLKNECRNTRRLAHPHIVRVFDFHRFNDLAFISMEYIDGQDLAAYRHQRQPLSIAEIKQILNPVINALNYAHELGLVHRDVKASNILIDRQNSPRLTDFGIAGVFKSDHNALQITSGGSLFCMSPQQLDGRPPRPSDDIYALGVLLYELLTGYPPFYPDITRDKILHEVPVGVNQRLGRSAAELHIPEALEDLIARMLAKKSDERPSSMQEIENRLGRLLETGLNETWPPDVADFRRVGNKPSANRVEAITPVRLALKVPHKRLTFSERSNRAKGLTLVCAFVFLITGGLWLWHYLAGRSSEPPPAQIAGNEQRQAALPATDAKPAVESEKSPDPAKLSADREQAEQKLAEFMLLKQELESKGAPVWGNEAYSEMMQMADQADRLLVENDYLAAAEKYAQATAGARILAGRIEPTLKRLLTEGQTALTEGNADLALQKLAAALMIDPDNKPAQHSLQRAKNAAAVTRLLEPPMKKKATPHLPMWIIGRPCVWTPNQKMRSRRWRGSSA